jgi:P4 family phage/plasmid primase-like protien
MTVVEFEAAKKRAKRNARASATGTFERGDHVEIAGRLVSTLRETSPTVYADGKMYAYSDDCGIFEAVDPARMSRIVQSFAGSPVGEKGKTLALKASDVHGAIKLAGDQAAEPEFFASAHRGIAFADGFVEVTHENIIKREHSPDHRARFVYGFEYVETAAPTRLLEFFVQVFRGDDDRAEKIRLVQEYLGISLLGLATSYQRALVFLGDGANGKGVLQSVAERCFPPGSVASVPPQDAGQEYRRAMLAGKLLNVVSELPEADIMDSESWKTLVAGDTMTGREIRQSPFTFKPLAGHVYSANRLPGTTDQSHGFWRRLIVITFGRIFEESEQNPRLADELVTEQPAIVSWFLAGAQRALAQGGFTVPASSAAAKERWQMAADQVRAFVSDSCTRLPLDAATYDWTPARQLYRAYRVWAVENGHRPVNANKFSERMKLLGLEVRHDRTGNRYPVRLEREETDE